MKPDIHPKYNKLVITNVDGTKFETKSTYSKGELLLDVDYRKHPAWTGGISNVNEKASAVASFNKKFSGMNFGSSTKKKD